MNTSDLSLFDLSYDMVEIGLIAFASPESIDRMVAELFAATNPADIATPTGGPTALADATA
jgi:hypothetical protein